MAEIVGFLNGWRLIPETALARCSESGYEDIRRLHQIYDAWSAKNKHLSEEINKIIDQAAPIIFPAHFEKKSDSRVEFDEVTINFIEKKYLSNDQYKIGGACAFYEEITEGLSNPDAIAAVKGHMFSAKFILSKIERASQ